MKKLDADKMNQYIEAASGDSRSPEELIATLDAAADRISAYAKKLDGDLVQLSIYMKEANDFNLREKFHGYAKSAQSLHKCAAGLRRLTAKDFRNFDSTNRIKITDYIADHLGWSGGYE